MDLPNTTSEEESYELARRIVNIRTVKEANTIWLCGLINHGNDLADRIEPHLLYLLGRQRKQYFRLDLAKGIYVLDDLTDPTSNKWRTVNFPESPPPADVIIGVNDISITGRTLIGFNIESLRRGYVPVTCVYEDQTGIATICMVPSYQRRIPVTDYLRDAYPHSFGELTSNRPITEIVESEIYVFPSRPKVTV